MGGRATRFCFGRIAAAATTGKTIQAPENRDAARHAGSTCAIGKRPGSCDMALTEITVGLNCRVVRNHRRYARATTIRTHKASNIRPYAHSNISVPPVPSHGARSFIKPVAVL
jgi:hypothetical protein